ncbi:hypothetical protein BGZ60DRAFT_111596 [Tricladium varicosporioides]|nr:hypothetical protein BGZ60DRAFT_111596 [Hymenoscyphus varicosporioides]
MPDETTKAPPLPASDSASFSPNFSQALDFINKMQAKFPKDKSDTYKKFLSLLQEFKDEKKSVRGVWVEMKELLGGDRELEGEFEKFLPLAEVGVKL